MLHDPQAPAKSEAPEAGTTMTEVNRPSHDPFGPYRANVRLIQSRLADEDRKRAKAWWRFR